jgi:TPR repeat protein
MTSVASHSASPERAPRKPISMAQLSTQFFAQEEQIAEKVPNGRPSMDRASLERKPLPKPLPEIPLPSPDQGRMGDSPLSPVRINFQNEDWSPQAFSAEIETVKSEENKSSTRASDSTPDRGNDSSEATIHEVPARQNYNARMGPHHESQSGILANIENGTSTPSSEPSGEDGSQWKTTVPTSDASSASSALDMPAPVPQFQYHHQKQQSVDSNLGVPRRDPMGIDTSLGQSAEAGAAINRHLTPTSQHHGRRSVVARPASAYSNLSDFGPRGRSPGQLSQSPSWSGRAPSAHSGMPDSRPVSYVDLLNVPYPQPPPVPTTTFDNSQLRNAVGSNASLLSTMKTLEMYRLNVKKTQDPSIQYAFALFLIGAAQEAGLNDPQLQPARKASPKLGRDLDSPYIDNSPSSPHELLREARQILQRLADRSYPFAQYYLADGYASGLFSKGKEDYDRAFPLFIAASKHGHAESGYRAALCYEFGWGCRKDPAKAVQFYRQSASKNHPGAMTRLGRACLSGDLGLNKYREGLKWLKRATESADAQYNAAPYHLGLLYETGYGDDLFQDETYAAQLFTQAADLGNAEAAYRLGDAYEHGKLSCPQDPALSVHFYTLAAQKGQAGAMMALCAWYMVGAEPVLEKDENEAYEWARRAAECGKFNTGSTNCLHRHKTHPSPGLTKAEYAVGYFTEMGIGCRRDPLEANVWYVRAAEQGDERAKHRLAAIRAAAAGGNPIEVHEPKTPKVKKHTKRNSGGGGSSSGQGSPMIGTQRSASAPLTGMAAAGLPSPKGEGKDKDCVVM